MRSVNGLYFLVFSTAEERGDGETGDRGMSRPNRGGDRDAEGFVWIPSDDMIGSAASSSFDGGAGGPTEIISPGSFEDPEVVVVCFALKVMV